MTERQDDFGPTMEPSPRRDPRLSVERDRPRNRLAVLRAPEIPGEQVAAGLGTAAVAILILAATAIAAIAAGLLVHALWDAATIGWRILHG